MLDFNFILVEKYLTIIAKNHEAFENYYFKSNEDDLYIKRNYISCFSKHDSTYKLSF